MAPTNSTELKYIEDPDVSRVVREIAARWPEIGNAADHPLTEFFILRKGQPGILFPVLNHLRWFLWALVVTANFWFPLVNAFLKQYVNPKSNQYWEIIAGFIAIIFGTEYLLSCKIRSVRSMSTPFKLISANPDQNCWIWLSGLTFAQFIGISFAHSYWISRGLFRVRYYLCLLFSSVALLLFGVFIHCNASAALLFTVVVSVPVGIVCILYCCEPAVTGHVALGQITVLIKSRRERIGCALVLQIMIIIGSIALFCNQFYLTGIFAIAFCCFWIDWSRRDIQKCIPERFNLLIQQDEKFNAIFLPEIQNHERAS